MATKEEHQEEDGPDASRGGKASADDDGGDACSFSQSQALPVADGIPDFEGEPTTAEEYLARVRWEAQQCPQVVRVEVDESATNQGSQRVHSDRGKLLNEDPDIASAPPELCPKPRWVQAFASSFSDLREELQECSDGIGRSSAAISPRDAVPQLGHIDAWESFVGIDQDGGGDEGEDAGHFWQEGCQLGGHAPETSYLLSLDQVTTTALLERLVDRFINSAESLPSHNLTAWLFSLAARIEKPLTADVEATLRALLRHASALRLSEAIGGSAEHPALPRLNLLAAIAGGYFGQDETLCTLMDT